MSTEPEDIVAEITERWEQLVNSFESIAEQLSTQAALLAECLEVVEWTIPVVNAYGNIFTYEDEPVDYPNNLVDKAIALVQRIKEVKEGK